MRDPNKESKWALKIKDKLPKRISHHTHHSPKEKKESFSRLIEIQQRQILNPTWLKPSTIPWDDPMLNLDYARARWGSIINDLEIKCKIL